MIYLNLCLFLAAIPIKTGLTPRMNEYLWLETCNIQNALVNRITVPGGFERIESEPGTFAHWLRHLPLKSGSPPVYLYDGREKPNQNAHAAVVDMDVGRRDLQQCADAVIRLRAEYLYARNERESIQFDFTSGDTARYADWAAGIRPQVEGRRVRWMSTAAPDPSYTGFRNYLTTVFIYAGTLSLSRELEAVTDPGKIEIGDVFIRGGSPGHAAIVVDVAVHRDSRSRIFLLAQSYMPAQEVHILKNDGDGELSPWYSTDFGQELVTPEWIFKRNELKRFR